MHDSVKGTSMHETTSLSDVESRKGTSMHDTARGTSMHDTVHVRMRGTTKAQTRREKLSFPKTDHRAAHPHTALNNQGSSLHLQEATTCTPGNDRRAGSRVQRQDARPCMGPEHNLPASSPELRLCPSGRRLSCILGLWTGTHHCGVIYVLCWLCLPSIHDCSSSRTH